MIDVNGKPVDGATVYLLYGTPQQTTLTIEKETLATTTTNPQGQFTFQDVRGRDTRFSLLGHCGPGQGLRSGLPELAASRTSGILFASAQAGGETPGPLG